MSLSMKLKEPDIHQENVNWYGSNTQLSKTLGATTPVLIRTSRCSQTLLELSKTLSDSAREFSGAPGSSCSYGGAFRMLWNLSYRRVKLWSSWDFCRHLGETVTEAESAAQLCGILQPQLKPLHTFCGRLCAVFSQHWFLNNHKAFHLSIFLFFTVIRFATS